MSVMTRRDRTVAFRLSQEEYQALHDLCSSLGARSVSDFARSAVCQVMASANAGLYPFLSQLRSLTRENDALNKRLSELSGRVDAWHREQGVDEH